MSGGAPPGAATAAGPRGLARRPGARFETALQQLSARGIVELDVERKASMVSNLLVVLCGERATQPVINAGTIY